MANIKLKKFDMKSIRDDKVIVFIGKRETGKSFLNGNNVSHAHNKTKRRWLAQRAGEAGAHPSRRSGTGDACGPVRSPRGRACRLRCPAATAGTFSRSPPRRTCRGAPRPAFPIRACRPSSASQARAAARGHTP